MSGAANIVAFPKGGRDGIARKQPAKLRPRKRKPIVPRYGDTDVDWQTALEAARIVVAARRIVDAA